MSQDPNILSQKALSEIAEWQKEFERLCKMQEMYDFIENQANHPEAFGELLAEQARTLLLKIDCDCNEEKLRELARGILSGIGLTL